MNKVADTIIKEAETKASNIQKDCEKKILLLKEEHEHELKAIDEKQDRKLQNTYETLLSHSKDEVQLNNNKKILIHKHKLIESVLESAKEKIINNYNLYVALIKIMLKKGLSSGKEEILITSEDEDTFNKEIIPFIKNDLGFNDITITQDPAGTFKGFYLKDGKSEFNGTIKVIFRETYEDLEVDIIKKLFE